MAAEFAFSEEEMAVGETLGYPKAYAKLCRDRSAGPYSLGPPYTFTPYSLQHNEAMREMELDQLFPILNPKAKATGKPKHFVNILWKQLSHLGNAGFDPEVIRVDPYGNVLYYHADPASPLAWAIDHWFPCSRGGLSVPSNLRILQWQVRKRKHNKLEFLIPWWDLQLGVTVNQFLSIFASSNSDFRRRGFSFLFFGGESEELNGSQTVDSYAFPQHFIEVKDELGLAPAAIVVSRKEAYDSSSALKSLDYNRQLRPQSPVIAARKVKHTSLKENENPNLATNPYQALVMARDSLKQRDESSNMETEVRKLDNEVNELKETNEEERLTIQDLELVLMKRRRRAEKCRRLAEAQSSYRTMLEKMIRDAMHQSVMYKEQVRLNQAASNALMARLEAQKAICDASERELRQKHKQRDDLERQVSHDLWHARKRSRMEDILSEEESKPILRLPGLRPKTQLHKELRVFLEEDHKASEAELSPTEEQKQEELEAELQKSAKKTTNSKSEEHKKCIIALEDEIALDHNNLQRLQTEEIGESSKLNTRAPEEPEKEEDEESRQQRGKGNVEKWLQMLLENGPEELDSRAVDEKEESKTDDILVKMNAKYPQKSKNLKVPGYEHVSATTDTHGQNEQQVVVGNHDGKVKEEIVEIEKSSVSEAGDRVGIGSRKSSEWRKEKNCKEREIARSESARILRRIPSSPSLILGMRKGIDFMRKKPIVTSDDDADEDNSMGKGFIKSSIKTIKKAVKI